MSIQIDLEDAIAATKAGKHPTVRAYAEANGCPEWRVRKSIDVGTLEADVSVRPMRVTGGELALTVTEWQRAIEPATRRIKPSVCGWANGGKTFTVLDEAGVVHTWSIALLKARADEQRREIDAVLCRRILS